MLRSLLACGFLLGSLTGAARAADPTWEMRHNLTAAEFEKTSKELAQKGYRPAQLSAAAVGKDKEVRFLAVWEKAEGPAREARHDLTAKQYQTRAAELKEKGFRPLELCGYEVDGEPRFAAIWEKQGNGDLAREARHDLTSEDYRAQYAALSNKGYRPIRVTGYAVGNETRYATVWEKEAKHGPTWHTRRDLTAAQYQEVFEERLKAGDRVVHLSVYTIDGEMRFAGVWENSKPPAAWQVRHGLDAKSFETLSAQYKGQGLRPHRLNWHAVNGEPRFVGMWVRE